MLIEKIKAKRSEIWMAERNLRELKLELTGLESQQHFCDHTFSAPIPGYEHEGGTCTQCGINEVHASCMKIGAKYRG